MSATHGKTGLRLLAGAYGVQSSYRDALGKQRRASVDGLLATLRALGAHIQRPEDALEAFRKHQADLWYRTLEPVNVVWKGRTSRFTVRLPESYTGTLECVLTLEDGTRQAFAIDPENSKRIAGDDSDGQRRVALSVPFPSKLPLGYHRLELAGAGTQCASLVICSPPKAFTTGREDHWGIFVPLYALRTQRGLGAGDLTDLSTLIDWIGSLGGDCVATLPLLATFLRKPFEPSPYAPVSRLFWNEFYLDLQAPPEFAASPIAQELFASAQSRAQELRGRDYVDYAAESQIRRQILERMAETFFGDAANAERRTAFDEFCTRYPDAVRYAQFQATVETRGETWPAWPEDMRNGHLTEPDYDSKAFDYHLFAQWLIEEQVTNAAAAARQTGLGLYLDLPLGVHYDGFDVWSNQSLFALGHAAGAPPDPLFTKGQNWGFPPMIPQALRENGYRYFIDFVRRHLEHAGVLRLDHVMQLHRLFWVPHGMDATEGLYVHYRAEETYAILNLESHRHRSLIVGENLGTVPRAVNQALGARNIQGMYVVQYEMQPDAETPLRPVPGNVVASMNTHDMPTFASFWHGRDIDDRLDMGLLDENGAEKERGNRETMRRTLRNFAARRSVDAPEPEAELRAILDALAESRARMVLVNLEDLWFEERPQNTPGTVTERPNWTRRMAHDFNAIRNYPHVLRALQSVNQLRRARGREKHHERKAESPAK